MLQYINWYYNSFDELNDELASPLLADLHDLPKTLILSAEYDSLKNEEKAYADKMQKAGGDVTYAMASPMNGLMNLCQRNPKKHGI